jgi:hypothetical protein
MEVIKSKLEKIMEKVPEVVFQRKNLANAAEFEHLDSLVCQYCKYIPLEPIECDKCQKMFCKICLNRLRDDEDEFIWNQNHPSLPCDQHHKDMPMRIVNKVFFENVYHKLKFNHNCNETEEEAPAKTKGKAAASKKRESKAKDKASKKKEEIALALNSKIYSYQELLKHLSKSCKNQDQCHSCPL